MKPMREKFSSGFALSLYRKLARNLFSFLDPRSGLLADDDVGTLSVDARLKGAKETFWIHAASAGELEGLRTVALALAERGFAIFITVFSPSASRQFFSLKKQLEEHGCWAGGGFSPAEGQWFDALSSVGPKRFITAKYEAWPDLWSSAAQLSIPISIVGSRNRPSIRIAYYFTLLITGGRVPSVQYLCFDPKSKEGLEISRYRNAEFVQVRDPRWDEVLLASKASKARDGFTRFQDILSLLRGKHELPRPWFVLGNLWVSDLDRIPSLIDASATPSTLWVVPHLVSGKEPEALIERISKCGWTVVRSSHLKPFIDIPAHRPLCIFIDEIGVLKAIYHEADRVYVGGGFGAGIHNVMEPTVSGAPLLIGPVGAEKFVEVQQLLADNEIQIVKSDEEFKDWLGSLGSYSFFETPRSKAFQTLIARSGGTQDVVAAILGSI
jgi:3-deoxy-D-manno-octulosonic-acid transferase